MAEGFLYTFFPFVGKLQGLHQVLQQAAVCSTNLPTVSSQDLELWFIKEEGKFRMHKIVALNLRYDLVDTLLLQAAMEVRHHYVSRDTEVPYVKFMTGQILGLFASERRRLHQLLRIQNLGAHRPFQFLRTLLT